MKIGNDTKEILIVIGIFAFAAAVVIGAGAGWVLNIVKLVPMEGATGTLVLRAVGVFFAPLGVVLGYCG